MDPLDARQLTTEQAARAVGVTVRSLGRYRARGAPCSPGPRKTVLYSEIELRAWMRAQGLDGGDGGPPDERQPAPATRLEAQAHGGALLRHEPAPPAPAPTRPAAPDGQTPREKLQEVRARKEQLTVERQELDLAQRRGELVTVDEARRLVRAHFVLAKARCAAWPARVAQALEGLPYDARLGALERELGALLDDLGAVPA